VTTKYLAKFQSPRAITRPKIIGPERKVKLICNSSLYTHIPNIKSISPSIAKKKWWQLNIWPNFSPRAITRPKIIRPERNVHLICNLSLYTHIPNIKSISQSIAKTRCVGTTWMSLPWILRRLAIVSPFFNSLSNRLRITNYSILYPQIIVKKNIWPNFKAHRL
jgi:hypothetical protein